jgi:hypothetical protein
MPKVRAPLPKVLLERMHDMDDATNGTKPTRAIHTITYVTLQTSAVKSEAVQLLSPQLQTYSAQRGSGNEYTIE